MTHSLHDSFTPSSEEGVLPSSLTARLGLCIALPHSLVWVCTITAIAILELMHAKLKMLFLKISETIS